MLSKVFALALVAVVPAVYAQLPPDCDRTYTVQPGDTCDSIGATQDVSTFQLAFVNPTINSACSNLFVGALLCLGRTGMDCNTVHVVESGDFCAGIAGEAGISVDTLLANNPNVNSGCTNIAIGEVLCTAANVIPYNTTSTA